MSTENATESKSLVVLTTVPGFMEAADIISKLRAKYDGVTYDVSNPTGMAKAVFARKELRDARIALDKKKPEVKREALDFCNKVEADYKAIRAAVSEYEDIPDKAITAENERKAAIKAEQDRLKAEAQKLLDDKISAISQLPLKIIGKNSGEIETFLSTLEGREFGAEFTGDTLARAQAAKQTAVEAIRQALTDTRDAEEKAAQAERERIERERVDAITRKIEVIRCYGNCGNYSIDQLITNIRELEALVIDGSFQEFEEEATAAKIHSLQTMQKVLADKQEEKRLADEAAEQLKRDQAELAEQKRLQNIEAAKALAELKRLQLQQAEMQAKIDAENAKIEAEKKRLADEEAARQAEIEAAALAEEEAKQQVAIADEDASQRAEILSILAAKEPVSAQEMITIPLEHYNELKRDSEILHALKRAGVERWENWEDAMSLLEDGE